MCKNRKKVNREQETGDRNNLFILLQKKFFYYFCHCDFSSYPQHHSKTTQHSNNMDSTEILSIIIAIAAYVFFTVRKYKKKEEAQKQARERVKRWMNPQQQSETSTSTREVKPEWREPWRPAPPVEEEAPKKEYFTYEDVSAPVVEKDVGETTVEKQTVTADNPPPTEPEEKNNSNLYPLADEIEKAVIYSEILKRPYN